VDVGVRVEVHHGDCMSVMRDMPDASVDSVVTDPPYHLTSIVKRFGAENAAPAKGGVYARSSAGFMGKRWDGGDIAFTVELWAEVFRVLKPGGHMLAFGGTRTYHRMACAIEDAGFEIRDQLGWLYGSGFPKSLDVGKALDKAALSAPLFDEIRSHVRHWRDARGLTNPGLNDALGLGTNGCGMARHWTSEVGSQHSIPSKDQWRRLKALLAWPDCELDAIYDRVKDGAERPTIGTVAGTRLAVAPGQGEDRRAVVLDITAPATDLARQWDGWGTALKPAWEPICLARKPLIGTVAENIAAHGTGGLNIGACRIPSEPVTTTRGKNVLGIMNDDGWKPSQGGQSWTMPAAGRWPANLVHDGSDEVLEAFAAFGPTGANGGRGNFKQHAWMGGDTPQQIERSKGTAARFFYCGKTSANERRLDGAQIIIDTDRSQVGDGKPWRAAGTTQEARSVRLLVDTDVFPPRVTGVFGAQNSNASEWNTLLFGKMPTDLSRLGGKFTTSTKTSSTTYSAILNWLTLSLTSDSTAAVSLETAFGLSRAESAASLGPYRTTTNEPMASAPGASRALSLGPFRISVDDAKSWHPTVKPQSLMRWLCRLITPPGGTVLDPFAGSGSTLLAARAEGFHAVGIEREAEYVEIARRRLSVDAPLFSEVA
jgi:DNA modification methylase